MKTKFKTRTLSLLMAFLFSLALTACGSKGAIQEIHTLAEAKSDLYESVEELEAAATVILRVKKTEQEENVVQDMGAPNTYWGYTLSQVQVEEIMKNISGQEIAIGDEIPILENQFTYMDTDNTSVTCHINQYQMMEPGNEYFLYLYYSPNNGWYVILSGLFGKVPVSEEEAVVFPASEFTLFQGQALEDDSFEQVVLENIREESLERYN